MDVDFGGDDLFFSADYEEDEIFADDLFFSADYEEDEIFANDLFFSADYEEGEIFADDLNFSALYLEDEIVEDEDDLHFSADFLEDEIIEDEDDLHFSADFLEDEILADDLCFSAHAEEDEILADDLNFSGLYLEDEIFPISEEKYAQELQLQESSSSSKKKHLLHTSKSLNSYCGICMDPKTESEMFRNTNVCEHLFCSDCIHSHVAAKIKDNVTNVKCPDPECKAVIGPETCRSIMPKQVLERWESALCESLILGSEKFYCPFKDCSAMLVDDGCGRSMTSSECPNCNRLFCVQCKVAWHSGMDCSAYRHSKKGDEREDVMLIELAKNKKWRRCPKCKYFVERIDGCLHISCRCGFQFCYGCGEEHNSSHVCASV